MMGMSKLKSMAEAGLKEAGGLPAEILLEGHQYDLTRFAEGQVHQNISMDGVHVTARVFSGTKRGEVTLSAPGTERVREAVRRAVEVLKYAGEGPERPMPGPGAGYLPDASIPGFDERVETCGADWRAETARDVVKVVEREGPRPFGRAVTEVNERLIMNSEGLVSYTPRTACDLIVTTIRSTGYGYSERHGYALDDINPEEAGMEAAGGCNMARNPQSFPAGDYSAILLPYATADMVSFLARLGADGEAIGEGRSFMSDRMGERVLPERIDLWDDGFDPRGRPVAFDGEGVAKQRVDIIQGGVARGGLYNQTSGRALDRSSTGHAVVSQSFGSFRGGGGVAAQNLFLGEGSATVEEMIRDTDLGLLITNFHYTRVVEPRDVIITGMTRNGTFLVRNGAIVGPVKNLRFTDSYVRALNGLTHLGSESMLCGEGVGSIRVPAIRLESLRFTGTTDF